MSLPAPDILTYLPRTASLWFQGIAIFLISLFLVLRLFLMDVALVVMLGASLIILCYSFFKDYRHQGTITQKQVSLICASIMQAYSSYQIPETAIYLFALLPIYFFIFNLKIATLIAFVFLLINLLGSWSGDNQWGSIRFLISGMTSLTFLAILAYVLEYQRNNLYLFATTDDLTGARNRKTMYANLENARQAWLNKQVPSSLVMMDLDHFKQINDQQGHLFGDKVLRTFAEHLMANLDDNEILYRYGGEEFLIIMRQCDQPRAYARAQQLKTSAHEVCLLKLHQQITCSMGVGALCNDENCETWIKACDNALYQAKKDGRNRVIHRAQQEAS